MLDLLKPAPPQPLLPPGERDAAYHRLKWQVFAGIFIGYAPTYLVRKNLSLAIPDVLHEYPHYTKAQLGTALTALSLTYRASKFLMGSVSDRSNPKYFLPLAILLSAICTACMGFRGLYVSLGAVIALQALNGWVQGMAWPPCGKTVVQWFPLKERGRVMSFWNVAHNVGGALVATIALWGLRLFGDWSGKFLLNAIVAAIIGAVAFALLRDGPESCGLPPIPPSPLEENSSNKKEIFT